MGTDLAALLRSQDNVVARRQLVDAGLLSRSAVARRVRPGGPWQVLVGGSYGAFTGAPTPAQLMRAALLHAGDGSFLTGATGCELHGLRKARPWGRRRTEPAIVVSTARRLAPVPGITWVRTDRPAPVVWINGLTVGALPRCVIDAALFLDDLDDVRAVVAEPVQRRMMTAAPLVAELAGVRRNGSRLVRRAVGEVAAGARSSAEAEQVALTRRSTVLPSLHYNCSIYGPQGFVACIDAYAAASGVAQEMDSVEFHIDPAAWKATLARQSRLVALGIRVLSVPPSRLRTDAAGVLREFEAAHLIGLRSGPPPGVRVVCRPDCPLRESTAPRG